MKSRLKKSNKRSTLPLLCRSVSGRSIEVGPALVALRDWIPSSPMPRPALCEPGYRQPTSPKNSVLGQGIDRVLTAGWDEPARRRAQRRHHVPVKLNEIDQRACHGGAYPAGGANRARRVPLGNAHRSVPASSKARRSPLRSCCSSHADDTCLLLGKARITTWSCGCKLSSIGRAT